MEPSEIVCYVLVVTNIILWAILEFHCIAMLWYFLAVVIFYLNAVYGDFNVNELLEGKNKRSFPIPRSYWDQV